ncbi:MAG: UbiA family prenyltransferase [Acidobacteria bacterium]|nr:UbiA family prenyltransferase [Acidobacteriota bacterium]
MWRKLQITLEMIKFEHTVFAFPFALLSAFLAAGGMPAGRQLLWIAVAMVGARSAAMAFNRLVDHSSDALNPRTAKRALPRGLVSRRYVWLFTLASGGVFLLAAGRLNRLAFLLSPVALAIIFLYSYAKRFTAATHLFLGLALSLAPIGAWVAVRGKLSATPLILGLAVALWVAGFDIIYACQDVEFDRRASLNSIPKKFGIAVALRLSSILHALMLCILTVLFWKSGLGWISYAAVGVVAILLAYEHFLISPQDLSQVNAAFFTINGWISILLFVLTSVDILSR